MPTRWVVLKLGTTGIAHSERWRTLADLIRQRIQEGLRPLVVLPSLPRMPDLLWGFLAEAGEGGGLRELVDEITDHHLELAEGLGFGREETEALLRPDLQELWRLAVFAGVRNRPAEEAALSAEVMTVGELLLTRIAAAWLNRQGLPAAWHDARTSLVVPQEETAGRLPRIPLDDPAPDDSLIRRFEALPRVVVTQGGIAGVASGGSGGSSGSGGTARLGHGGADFSAACFAVKLGAARCEIWSDGPGLFTGDPALLPSAQLLRVLSHEEAQEVLTTGGRGPHPRAIPPLRRHGIPLHIGWLDRPEVRGTVVTSASPVTGPQVKAVAARNGITLVSMETVGMWREVGFLARVFDIFARQRLSIDAISSSETNVTVTLDPDVNVLDAGVLRRLLRALAPLCETRVVAPVASVSLVGRGIRAALHGLGPVLEAFEERTVHLLTESASDLNLTFVVDEDQSEKLVRQIHGLLFQHQGEGAVFGPTWEDLRGPDPAHAGRAAGPAVFAGEDTPWWQERRSELLALTAEESPLYVYDAETLEASARSALGLEAVDRVFYAMKANNHPGVLACFHALGIGFECVSAGELDHVLGLFPDLPGERLLFTPNFAPRQEYRRALEREAYVTVDSLHPLRDWPDLFAGREIFLRLDPGHGRGHHAHVRTAGAQSKFGISPEEVEQAAAMAAAGGARVVGLHAHAGSGIRVAEAWAETARFLAATAPLFPHLRALDLGGGLGIPERPGQPPLDLDILAGTLRAFRRDHPGLELWLEPGRYLVAQAGVLLARVVQIKRKEDLTYVGLETGMNSLIRPALYGSYHPIHNLTRLDEPPSQIVHVVGPICETGDVLGRSRRIAPAAEGDVLLIANAGAYGRVMSSRYNLREPAAERLLPRRETLTPPLP